MKFFLSAIMLIFLSTPAFSADSYFPENAFYARKDLNAIISNQFIKHLKAMNEPSLYKRSFFNKSDTYRFLWLRTFDKPVCIKLQIKSNGAGVLYAKMTDGAGGYDPGKLILNKTVQLSLAESSEFLKKVEQANYWEMPSNDHSVAGLDGSRWLLEAVQKNQYHFVERWSPKNGGFKDLALLLIKLSGISGEKVY